MKYKLDGKVSDSFQAFLVDGARLTENEEYPVIEDWMISKVPPKKIMPFAKAITYKGDLSEVYVCTYSCDQTFERIRKDPKRYLKFFKRCAGIIGFDYSVHHDMPKIKQKSQMNDNLSLDYFYGSNGVKLIVNLRCGLAELEDEFFSAIPKRCLVAIGTHGFTKSISQQAEWLIFIEKIIDKLEPSGIIVYGPMEDNVFDQFIGKCDFFHYEPYQRKRNIGGEDYGN